MVDWEFVSVLETDAVTETLLISVPVGERDGLATLDGVGDEVTVTLTEMVMLGEGDVVPDRVADPVGVRLWLSETCSEVINDIVWVLETEAVGVLLPLVV